MRQYEGHLKIIDVEICLGRGKLQRRMERRRKEGRRCRITMCLIHTLYARCTPDPLSNRSLWSTCAVCKCRGSRERAFALLAFLAALCATQLLVEKPKCSQHPVYQDFVRCFLSLSLSPPPTCYTM